MPRFVVNLGRDETRRLRATVIIDADELITAMRIAAMDGYKLAKTWRLANDDGNPYTGPIEVETIAKIDDGNEPESEDDE